MTEGLIVSYAVSKFADSALEKLRDHCHTYRQREFWNSLHREIEKEGHIKQQSSAVNDLLKRLETDGDAREALFEAYKRASLSSSKTIGPRVCALLVANILLEFRQTTISEDRILDACERLSDRDFEEMHNYIQEQRTPKNSTLFEGESFEILNDARIQAAIKHENKVTVKIRSSNHQSENSQIDRSNINFNLELGLWAYRLEQCGIISQSIEETISKSDEGNTWGNPASSAQLTIDRNMLLYSEFFKLEELMKRARNV